MMIRSDFSIATVLGFGLLIATHAFAVTAPPVNVIYETDFTFDVDDVGALAVLHALADRGEANILAVMYNEVHEGGAEAIAAVNTWYGRPDIPIGSYRGILQAPDKSKYIPALSSLYQGTPPSIDAQELYRKILSVRRNRPVTIVSVGFLNNLYDLLQRDKPLIEESVSQLVAMGGIRNDSFNFVRHNLVDSTEYVIRNWPTKIVFSQEGHDIQTGAPLVATPENNPVREAYRQWFNGEVRSRSSWDQVAVLFAVRGSGDVFEESDSGDGRLRNGFVWKMKPGHRTFARSRLSIENMESLIDDLMVAAPHDRSKGSGTD